MKLNKNKKAIAPIVVWIISIAGIAILLGGANLDVGALTGAVGGGGYIEKPVFYYDKCEQVGSLKWGGIADGVWTENSYSALSSSYQWIPKPSITDEYSVKIRIDSGALGGGGTEGSRIKYSVCNSKVESPENCPSGYNQFKTVTANGQILEINNIKPEEYVLLEYQRKPLFTWKSSAGASYLLGFQPYGIRQYNVLSGSSNPINPNSCTYASTQTDTLVSTDSKKVSQTFSGVDKSTNERVLQPNEVRWYVAGYVSSAGPSFVLTYKNQEAWCRDTGTSAEIYKINTVTTSGGTYKIASPDWSDKLGDVTCCPGSTRGTDVCGSNYEWKSIQNSECGSFKSCGSPNWVPYAEKEIIKYSCVNGKCVSETKEVECASDYDCKESNQLCDLNSHECVESNVNLKGQEITTAVDSEAECTAKGGKWITTSSESKSIWNYLGIGKADIVVTEYCKFGSDINYFMWILIIGGIIVVYIFILRPILKGTKLGRILP